MLKYESVMCRCFRSLRDIFSPSRLTIAYLPLHNGFGGADDAENIHLLAKLCLEMAIKQGLPA